MHPCENYYLTLKYCQKVTNTQKITNNFEHLNRIPKNTSMKNIKTQILVLSLKMSLIQYWKRYVKNYLNIRKGEIKFTEKYTEADIATENVDIKELINEEELNFNNSNYEKRDRLSLHRIFQNEIGTKIHSNEWFVFKMLETKRYIHKTVNHSQFVNDFTSGAYTQRVERVIAIIVAFVLCIRLYVMNCLPSYNLTSRNNRCSIYSYHTRRMLAQGVFYHCDIVKNKSEQ
ncbi:hypothetical protein AGLY_013074 [Aphis glycines]|uniref:Uncharacterized protein n=1 Tax=Aphis glycines TaxID=307491 RepID=A0A6G0T8K1_APHGL|nr:hypothetical protein AGLY_013074 [Aphis glycines]